MPVFSIYTDSLNLYDWDSGILVNGPNANPNYPYHGANFWNNWERPVHVELYDKNKQLAFEQDMGIKVHGGSVNRSKPMKSLRMLAKKKYGKGRVDYPLISHKPIVSYKKFVLRNGSSDFCKSMFRDDMIHRMLYLKTHNDILGYEPAEVFLNGKYYGMENIREKRGKHYLNENYGVSIDSVDILREENILLEGDTIAFSKMYHFAVNHDLSIDSNYTTLSRQLDLLNFADYFITETYFDNNDWPYNNLEYWRPKKPDGKFRYALFDLDVALGGFLYSPYTNDELGLLLGPYGDTCKHVQILKSLLKNRTFHNYFINRYCDLVNTLFSEQNFKTEIEKTKAQIAFDIPQHFTAWGHQPQEWNDDIDTNMIPYVENRPEYALKQLQNNFISGNQVQLSLEVFPLNAGTIKLNSIEPEKFPWHGTYFSEIPINVNAIANLNYQFMGWGSDAVKLDLLDMSEQKIQLKESAKFIAYFKSVNENNISIFPNPAKEEIEIIALLPTSGGSETLIITDVSGKIISTDTFAETEIFHFKKNISALKPGNYLVSILGKSFEYHEKLIILK